MVSLQLRSQTRLYCCSVTVPASSRLGCSTHISRRVSGATLGTETFTDLDNADDVALLAETLEVLLLALDVLNDEARPLDLEVN